ncbi:MAG: deoxyuridine 5'-triphosphate nucleotidohydrolase [Halobacteriaceae archaeon]
MFESGAYVARHVDPVVEGQVQPNGVDLTLGGVTVQRTPGRIARDGKTIGERERVEPVAPDGASGRAADAGADAGAPVYRLEPGGYVLEYGERIAIPDDHVGFVLPRSSLMRNSCMLNTAVWDAGYEGRGEGLLQVHHQIEIEAGARVAQLVLATAEHDGTYDGTYQGERL